MSDPSGKSGGMKNEPLPSTAPQPVTTGREIRPAQLDFTLPAPLAVRRSSRRVRPCSRERAAWWFAQMRRAVDEGREIEITGVW
jgi:hypothetical protein